MRVEKPTSGLRASHFRFLILLAVILAVLFWKSFSPDFILFNNDGPLGLTHASWMQLPRAFFGSWYDLNTIGVNAGAAIPGVTNLSRLVLGPVGFAKFIIPLALWFLGCGAFFFFRRLGFTRMAAFLGALAACLTTNFFSNACWGSVPPIFAFGLDFLALGAVVKRDRLPSWASLALAGLAVGMNVVEAADIGAIFSILIAAFIFYYSLTEDGSPVSLRAVRGIGRTFIVAAFAGFMAAYAVFALVGSSITGISGTKQDEQTKAAHWDFATQWSLPKTETLDLIVPGLFGYRMDTPGGGNYWGAMGRDPAWYRYYEQGKKGAPPQGFFRYTGRGFYIGITIAFIGLWAALQSFRNKDSVFALPERKLIWFWSAAAVVALLFAYGRFAPFYQIIYHLPYFSTIRNPEKFIHIVDFSAVILFGYGVQGLSRRYLNVPLVNNPNKRLANWWAKASAFDRRWVVGSFLAVGLSLAAWLIYAASRHALENYIASVQFSDAMAHEIAGYSIRQVGWFVLLLAALTGLLLLIISGAFAGRRAAWAGIFIGALLIVDLVPADVHYIVFWNYKEKYEVGDPEPIIKFLAAKPYENRVAYVLPRPLSTPEQFQPFEQLYNIEWTQQLFPYYDIQTLDVVQMPRVPEDLDAFNSALQIGLKEDGQGHLMLDDKTMYRAGRLWQLTSTRYLVGPAPLINMLNQQFYTAPNRFRIVQRFELGARPGVLQPVLASDFEAVPTDNPNARYALFEFMDALPRANLYSNWEVNTNGHATLERMASDSFDPAKTVLLSEPLPAAAKPSMTNNSGTVNFVSYEPTDIKLEATPTTPSVLMLCDKYDPDWQVWVDGKRSDVLKCNFLMRGVYLEPGRHEVEFKFRSNIKMLYVNIAAILLGLCLLGYAMVVNRKQPGMDEPSAEPNSKKK